MNSCAIGGRHGFYRDEKNRIAAKYLANTIAPLIEELEETRRLQSITRGCRDHRQSMERD